MNASYLEIASTFCISLICKLFDHQVNGHGHDIFKTDTINNHFPPSILFLTFFREILLRVVRNHLKVTPIITNLITHLFHQLVLCHSIIQPTETQIVRITGSLFKCQSGSNFMIKTLFRFQTFYSSHTQFSYNKREMFAANLRETNERVKNASTSETFYTRDQVNNFLNSYTENKLF